MKYVFTPIFKFIFFCFLSFFDLLAYVIFSTFYVLWNFSFKELVPFGKFVEYEPMSADPYKRVYKNQYDYFLGKDPIRESEPERIKKLREKIELIEKKEK